MPTPPSSTGLVFHSNLTLARAPVRPKLTFAGRAAMSSATRSRLAHHKTVLRAAGITDLSALGTLRIGQHTQVTPGLLTPTGQLAPGNGVPVRRAFVFDRAGLKYQPASFDARRYLTTPFSRAIKRLPTGLKLAVGAVPVDEAYWAAKELVIADNTTVTFRSESRVLTILCEKLVLGNNVTFTWEPPVADLDGDGTPDNSNTVGDDTAAATGVKGTDGFNADSWGEGRKGSRDGNNGKDGSDGAPGNPGLDGPTVELWTLSANDLPFLSFRGQRGGQGGNGGRGGNGVNGRDGVDEVDAGIWGFTIPWVITHPTSGGDGGDSGFPGRGGNGGNGGNAGHFFFYCPQQPVNNPAGGTGLGADIAGGDGGAIGQKGAPGVAGNRGRAGNRTNSNHQVSDGRNGARHDNPRNATSPVPGTRGTAPEHIYDWFPITEAEFKLKLLAPFIENIRPPIARDGAMVTLEGGQFARGDRPVVMGFDGEACADIPVTTQVTFVDDKHITFRMPLIRGGEISIQVVRADGSRSNVHTMSVKPVVRQLGAGSTRATPGEPIIITGSGFSPRCTVKLDGQDMLDASGRSNVRFIDGEHLEFTPRRLPLGAPVRDDQVEGEPRSLEVVLATGAGNVRSDPFPIKLATYRLFVAGDSLLWGQGLRSDDSTKIDDRVAFWVRQQKPEIGVHITKAAHSGAIIGFAANGAPLAAGRAAAAGVGLPQEVNVSDPTIHRQVTGFSGSGATVNLVLINGGINDVNIRTLLPSTDDAQLKDLIDLHCRQNMARLLRETAAAFPRATIIVTGYMPIISRASKPEKVAAWLGGLGLLTTITTTVGNALSGPLGAAVGAAAGALLNEGVRTLTAANSRLFYEHSEIGLSRAVDEINGELIKASPARGRRIFLAAPEFDDNDSTFAPNAKFFGISDTAGPLDDTAVSAPRIVACDAYYGNDLIGAGVCHIASAGHPNSQGASRFADEIIAVLRMNGVFGSTKFDDGFLWGTATASYQVEGNITNNDWHIFSTDAGIHKRVLDLGGVGDVPNIDLTPPGTGVRHSDFPVLRTDIERMAALGLNAYRFSLEWSRIQPTEDSIDTAALDYYDSVLDALIAHGITPVVSISHVTLPQWVLTPPRKSAFAVPVSKADKNDPDYLASKQGWVKKETVNAFNRYVSIVVNRFRDKVEYWLTINEPAATTVGVGYLAGLWSPGFNEPDMAKTACLNLVAAHCLAYDTIKRIYGTRPSKVSFAHHMIAAFSPPPDHLPTLDLDPDGKQKALNQFNYFFNWHFLDSVMKRNIDTEISVESPQFVNSSQFLADRSDGNPHPFPTSGGRLDFVGVNYYRSANVLNDWKFALFALIGGGFTGGRFEQNPEAAGAPHLFLNELHWQVYPRGMYELTKEIKRRYDLPVLVTENGLPEAADTNRAAFTVANVQHLLRAQQDGVKVLGYLHWSLVDNWEWFEHYKPNARFGLFTIDRSSAAMDRKITEAALALHHLAVENGMGRAVERYGVLQQKGYGISPARLSASQLWEGNVGSANSHILPGDIILLLTQLSNGQIDGLLFHKPSRKWLKLQQVARTPTSLRCRFFFIDPNVVLEINASIDTQRRLTGSITLVGATPNTPSARPQSINARFAPLFGQWDGGTDIQRFEGTASEWRVRTLTARRFESLWLRAANVTVANDGSLRFNLGANAVTASLQGNVLVVTSQPTLPGGQSVTVRAERLPDTV